MKTLLSSVLTVFFAATSVSGCVNMSAVDVEDKSAVQGALKVGDRISVTTTEAQRYDLTVTDLSDAEIAGATADTSVVVIPYEKLASLEVPEARPMRTALALGGALVFSVAVIVEYPAYSLASILLFRE